MFDPSSLPRLVYGRPPAALADVTEEAVQVSPLLPGAQALEKLPEAGAAEGTMLAPPGTIERRHDMALLLRALAPEAPFTILAPKDLGGARLRNELAAFGCAATDEAKAHHRICRGRRPAALAALEGALAEGAPRRLEGIGLWSQPGIFSWDRLDPGTALLVEHLPPLAGAGADFGCGIGILAHAVLASARVTQLALLDIDARAVEAARRNVGDPRAAFAWTDVRAWSAPAPLDFVVTNPPFHDSGHEDRGLGAAFLKRAAEALKRGGRLYAVANRHLPYESVLGPLFRKVTPLVERGGYKVVEALR